MFNSAIISVAELQQAQLQGEDLVLFDCRFNLMAPEEGAQAYAQSHLAGAHYAHLDKDLSSAVTAQSGRHPLPDRASFAAWLAQRGVKPETWIVAYDAQQSLVASRLWWLARWIGHARVVVLDGGYPAAVAQGFAQDSATPALVVAELKVGEPLQAICTLEEVLGLEHDTDRVLVDVRAAARFRGEDVPIDPSAGHIPWAKNIPIDQLVKDGIFCSTEILKTVMSDQVTADQQAIFMCGSGVTACQAALAYNLAGLGDAHIYPGSWSEWIRDASRPISTISH